MFSAPLLRSELRGDAIIPAYIDGRYAELIRTLVLHYEAFCGQPYRDLSRSLAQAPGTSLHETRLVAGLRRVVEEGMRLEMRCPAEPRKIRDAVFAAAAADPDLPAGTVLAQAAERLGLAASLGLEHLYADLRHEGLVRFPRPIPSVGEIIGRYNFRLLQGLLCRADRLRVEADGQARAIHRLAKLQGLLIEVKRMEGEGGSLDLEITGPFSLFQRTQSYGRALGRFLPACATAGRFRIEADVATRGGRSRLVVTSEDRILTPHRPPRQFDSKVEEWFLLDFLRLSSRWNVAREERIVPLGNSVFIPDFTFRLRADPTLQVDLEIVGFWTRDYLARKRALVDGLPGGRTIFCVDERFRCDIEGGPAPCIPFVRRVQAAKVLEVLEGFAP